MICHTGALAIGARMQTIEPTYTDPQQSKETDR